MKTRGTRRRNALRWSVYACAAISVLLLAVSLWYKPYYYRRSPTNASGVSNSYSFVLLDGVLLVHAWQERPPRPHPSAVVLSGIGSHGALPPRWYAPPSFAPGALRLTLVYPTVLLLVLAVVLRRRGPKRPAPGHCPSCNYNLAGLETTTCPECGREGVL